MEIGHNVMHGQWDWMRDEKIHSTTWEWDSVAPAEQWKHLHNYVHHTFTNVLGKDDDLGFGLVRIAPEQEWHPFFLAQPVYALLLQMFFEYGVAVADLELDKVLAGEDDRAETRRKLTAIRGKIARQWGKDYVGFPLLTGRRFGYTLAANATANIARNLWASTIIYCGHFPDGAEVFPESWLDEETKGEWYVRQLLGTANISGGRLFHIMTGNLSHQIEHHLFPDLPSNRYAELAPRVRALCEKYDLPYSTGGLTKQIGSTWSKIFRHALPPKKTGTSHLSRPANLDESGTTAPRDLTRAVSSIGRAADS
ncbi:fatty acid desaturase family protein [Actinomadura flavalba]|uniref:fatty acid desaturase family protein n=1 Tax=Actinomadura flavalba TaxID=1120938 RepID=UPI001F0A3618|nr:acyl-CoA desaturase [Actinomadura flavalba]